MDRSILLKSHHSSTKLFIFFQQKITIPQLLYINTTKLINIWPFLSAPFDTTFSHNMGVCNI